MAEDQNIEKGKETEGGANAAPEGEKPTAVEPKVEDKTVPLAALTDERKKRQKADERLAKYESAEKEAADKAAQAAGDVKTAQGERDALKAKVEAFEKRDAARLETLTAELDDNGKAALGVLGDSVPLSDRLALAEQLSVSKPAKPGPLGGTGGGGTPAPANKMLPARITSVDQYHEAIKSGDKEIVAILADPDKRGTLREEVAKLN